MLHFQTNEKPFIKFLSCFCVLFCIFAFVSCQSSPPLQMNEETDSEDLAQIEIKKIKIDYIPYYENDMKIIRQETLYSDGTQLSTISSIWLLDRTFPIEIILVDDMKPNIHDSAFFYQEGDKIHLRAQDFFYPVALSITDDFYHDEFSSCHKDELRMFARIQNDFYYSGIALENKKNKKTPWFQYGNIVCAKIEKQ